MLIYCSSLKFGAPIHLQEINIKSGSAARYASILVKRSMYPNFLLILCF